MNQLHIINQNGKLLVDSREVAEMVNKQHAHLLRDIKGYSEILTESNFGLSDFFIESSYQDSTGRTLPCFLLTKKGCDMVANKLTGEKGVLFTATYVSKFEEMEQSIKNNVVPLSKDQALVTVLRSTADLVESHDSIVKEQHEIRKLVTDLDSKVEERITLDSGEQRRLQRCIATKVYELCGDSKERPKLFREIHREIKDRFAVASYKDVKRKELQSAIRYVENWIPRRVS